MTNRDTVVSVILVNFRGADDTIAALAELSRLDWPSDQLEIVVVENGSGDDSADRIRAARPDITLVVSDENLGFAGGCNLGVRRSRGEIVAFLNNDARPDPQWVSAAIAAFDASPTVGAVASRVLDWEGETVDYVGSAMTWFGMGFKPWTGDTPPADSTRPRDVLFATGSAMFVRRSAYQEVGGFDERYFMFFEDVDLGWRLNLAGWRVRYEPASLAFHRHHASMRGFGEHKEQYLLERNALYTLIKNSSDERLAGALPGAMALAVRRGIVKNGLDSESFDLRRGGPDDRDMMIGASAVSPLYAIDQLVDELPSLLEDRERIQSTRVASDARIWSLFEMPNAPVMADQRFLDGYQKLVEAFSLLDEPAGSHVLIITGDPIGPRLAGPAIRAWNMAQALSEESEVTLVSLTGVEDVGAPFRTVHVRPGDDRAFAPLEDWADVIVFQGHAMAVFDRLRRSRKILVVDIYDPMHLEQLEQARELGEASWAKAVSDATEVLNEQLERGDFFLAASERQRHFYLGQLAALGRLNPATYRDDPDLSHLIDVVPFGLSSTPPQHERPVVKGVVPGIGVDDKLVLWAGGLYNWFDPHTLIRAVARLAATHPEVKLFFQGTKHPHPGVPEMEVVRSSRALARELGVLDRAVFFNDSWVPYADRQNYLAEADAGVSTHFAHVETTFSFRTRILDYLWAELPMVVTEGDHFAELVERQKLGVVVPPDDVDAVASALERVLFDQRFAESARRAIRKAAVPYRWENVLAPLLRFVANPRPAADRQRQMPTRKTTASRPRVGLRHDLGLVAHHLRNGGPLVVARKVRRRLAQRRG